MVLATPPEGGATVQPRRSVTGPSAPKGHPSFLGSSPTGLLLQRPPPVREVQTRQGNRNALRHLGPLTHRGKSRVLALSKTARTRKLSVPTAPHPCEWVLEGSFRVFRRASQVLMGSP
jgi:hypothetical protein